MIKFWYGELGTISQTTEIFLVCDNLLNIVSKDRTTQTVSTRVCTQADILKYNLDHHHKSISYNYKRDLEDVCRLVVKLYKIEGDVT